MSYFDATSPNSHHASPLQQQAPIPCYYYRLLPLESEVPRHVLLHNICSVYWSTLLAYPKAVAVAVTASYVNYKWTLRPAPLHESSQMSQLRHNGRPIYQIDVSTKSFLFEYDPNLSHYCIGIDSESDPSNKLRQPAGIPPPTSTDNPNTTSTPISSLDIIDTFLWSHAEDDVKAGE